MVSLLASHLPGMPWATVSLYLYPTTTCLVCHRLNNPPVYIPIVALPGLPWATVSFYLCTTTACLVRHRLNTSPVVYTYVLSSIARLPHTRHAMGHCPLLPACPTTNCLICHRLNTSPCVYTYCLSSCLPPTRPAMGHCLRLPLPHHSMPSLSPFEYIPCVYITIGQCMSICMGHSGGDRYFVCNSPQYVD